MAFQENPDKIGAVWSKTGQRGTFYSGTINAGKIPSGENVRIVLFPVAKKHEKSPAFEILLSRVGEEVPNAKAMNVEPLPTINVDDEIHVADIPF